MSCPQAPNILWRSSRYYFLLDVKKRALGCFWFESLCFHHQPPGVRENCQCCVLQPQSPARLWEAVQSSIPEELIRVDSGVRV
jgi:hypothetical protein